MSKEADGSSSAITRSLDLIEAIALADRPVTLAELAGTSGMPKATLHRLCQRLAE